MNKNELCQVEIHVRKRTSDLDENIWDMVVVKRQGAEWANMQTQPWKLLLRAYRQITQFLSALIFVDLLNIDNAKFETCGK